MNWLRRLALTNKPAKAGSARAVEAVTKCSVGQLHSRSAKPAVAKRERLDQPLPSREQSLASHYERGRLSVTIPAVMTVSIAIPAGAVPMSAVRSAPTVVAMTPRGRRSAIVRRRLDVYRCGLHIPGHA